MKNLFKELKNATRDFLNSLLNGIRESLWKKIVLISVVFVVVWIFLFWLLSSYIYALVIAGSLSFGFIIEFVFFYEKKESKDLLDEAIKGLRWFLKTSLLGLVFLMAFIILFNSNFREILLNPKFQFEVQQGKQ